MTAAMYRWPDRGRVDRTIPKERLYVEAGASARLKQQFVDGVQRIRWAYKIGEESVRLAPVEPISEFQVFEVDLKGADLTDAVLKAIDAAIPSPIIFELIRPSGEVQMVAARKEPGLRGPKLSSYFRGDWQSTGIERRDLPPALNLQSLYEAILTTLLAVTGRPGEELSGAIERMARVAQLEREIGTLSRRLRTEPQLNRKIEFRRELKASKQNSKTRSRDRTPVQKLRTTSPDRAQTNVERLAELFPSVVTETLDEDGNPSRAIDFDLLRQELMDHVVEGPQERYQLDWPGKRAAAFASNAPIAKTLRPVRDESVDFDVTKNLFIEGDNLDALKLLQESYLGKVKLIYIDPPYNTGNDFVYEDDFAESSADYLTRSGQTSDTGDRLVANTEANGRFHSDWLSMMYARMKLARGLLTENGIAIVAIADHEHGNLRLLLDEVFGSDNFLANVVWQGGSKNDARFTSQGLDYMLIYARNVARLVEEDVRWTEPKKGHAQVMEVAKQVWDASGHDSAKATTAFRKRLREMRSDLEPAVFRYDQIDEQGRPFRTGDLAKPSATGTSRYDLAHPVTALPVKMPKEGWRFSPATMAERIAKGRVIFGPDHTSTPVLKRYLDEMDTQAIKPVFTQERASAAYALKKLLDSDVFPYTKDVGVLAKWINAVTQGDREAVILDFFAGSGSTGHAVMDLNVADGGNRRYILVQLDEAVDHPDYDTIADIARERLRRAGAQAKEAAGVLGGDLDVGFRSLRVDTTNLAAVERTPDAIPQEALMELQSSLKPDRTGEDILFEVFLSWGLDPSIPIAVQHLEGYEVFVVDDGALVACFEGEISPDLVRALARREPLRAVFRDSGFSSDAARINAEQIFRELSPATDAKVI